MISVKYYHNNEWKILKVASFDIETIHDELNKIAKGTINARIFKDEKLILTIYKSSFE
jgi:hypothetical protein